MTIALPILISLYVPYRDFGYHFFKNGASHDRWRRWHDQFVHNNVLRSQIHANPIWPPHNYHMIRCISFSLIKFNVMKLWNRFIHNPHVSHGAREINIQISEFFHSFFCPNWKWIKSHDADTRIIGQNWLRDKNKSRLIERFTRKVEHKQPFFPIILANLQWRWKLEF